MIVHSHPLTYSLTHSLTPHSLSLTPTRRDYAAARTTMVPVNEGITAWCNALDVLVNRTFKIEYGKEQWQYFTSAGAMKTKSGNFSMPSILTVCGWIRRALDRVKPELIRRAFLKAGVTNALDGTEDDFVFHELSELCEGIHRLDAQLRDRDVVQTWDQVSQAVGEQAAEEEHMAREAAAEEERRAREAEDPAEWERADEELAEMLAAAEEEDEEIDALIDMRHTSGVTPSGIPFTDFGQDPPPGEKDDDDSGEDGEDSDDGEEDSEDGEDSDDDNDNDNNASPKTPAGMLAAPTATISPAITSPTPAAGSPSSSCICGGETRETFPSMRDQLAALGLCARLKRGDGNCCPYSLADLAGISQEAADPEAARDIRDTAINVLRADAAGWRRLLESFHGESVTDAAWEARLNDIGTDKKYVGDLVINAIANHFKNPIIVLSPPPHAPKMFEPQGAEELRTWCRQLSWEEVMEWHGRGAWVMPGTMVEMMSCRITMPHAGCRSQTLLYFKTISKLFQTISKLFQTISEALSIRNNSKTLAVLSLLRAMK